MAAVTAWWLSPMPRGRIAILRTVLYLFILVDVLVTTSWVADHAHVPGSLYQPLFIGRLLPLPTPGVAFVSVLEVLLLTSAAVAATGRLPRLAGAAVAILYLEWMLVAFSYGKVDHDRFAFLIALAVMPTVGPARFRDRTPDEGAGWALRMTQVAVVATYFLAAFAKLRFGGVAWLDGATLLRAVVRRGTFLADPLLDFPELLHAAQYLLVAFELAAPLLLVRGRVGRTMLGLAVGFHLVAYAGITIIFLPHVICLLAFLPLERLVLRRESAAGESKKHASINATVTGSVDLPQREARTPAARARS